MRVAGERVFHQHRVRSVRVELAPRLVGNGDLGYVATAFERESVDLVARERDETPRSRLIAVSPVVGSSRSCSLDRAKPRLEVGEDVLDRLDADREAHEVGAHASRDLLLIGQL